MEGGEREGERVYMVNIISITSHTITKLLKSYSEQPTLIGLICNSLRVSLKD